jgi:hypothetical protein
VFTTATGGERDEEGGEKEREKTEIPETHLNQTQKIEGHYCKFDN